MDLFKNAFKISDKWILEQVAAMKADGKVDLSAMSSLKRIPPLPEGVRELKVNNTMLSEILSLPDSLRKLDLEGNRRLSTLPALPAGLLSLNIAGTKISSLPSPLPAGLEVLNCGYTEIQEIPELPPTLRVFYCDGMGGMPYLSNIKTLRFFPRLPDGLQQLSCRGQKLRELPRLPPTLEFLRCDENPIRALPELPLTLRILSCEGCLIRVIPLLPDVLEYADFRRNPLQPPYNRFWGRIGHLVEGRFNPRFFLDPYMRPILERFKQEVNDYYPIYITKSRGRNLATFEQTIGRPGAKLVTATAAGEAVEMNIPHLLGKKYGPTQIIGSFLTGKPETQELNTQKAALIANLPVGGRRRAKSRRHSNRRKHTRKHK